MVCHKTKPCVRTLIYIIAFYVQMILYWTGLQGFFSINPQGEIQYQPYLKGCCTSVYSFSQSISDSDTVIDAQ